ncbi:MAG: alkaline phosphatase family protein, partial [Acidobacteriota bacterium]
VFTVSLKDRAAILLGGKTADAAYWLDSRSAQFVTSRYYRSSYPEWVTAFRERKIPESYFGKTWDALPGSARHHAAMDIRLLDHGVFAHGFPHFFGGLALEPGSSFYNAFLNSPFVDSYMTEFAKALIENEGLGGDEAVDYLGLSYSALDLVGHDYGPNSPEVLDTVLRLDRTLGDLLRFVDERVGLDRVAVVFSSDHGVVPLPEYRRTRGRFGKRTGWDEIVCFQQAGRRLQERFGAGPWFLATGYLDYQTLGKHNLKRQEVEEALAGWLEECPSVERVWTRSELEKPASDGAADPRLELYRHSFHPERSPDFFVQFKEYHLNMVSRGTNHGTPYPYDSHVPLFFLLPGAEPKTVSQRVRTVDVAPTLAAWLGIPAPRDLDGIDLSRYIF